MAVGGPQNSKNPCDQGYEHKAPENGGQIQIDRLHPEPADDILTFTRAIEPGSGVKIQIYPDGWQQGQSKERCQNAPKKRRGRLWRFKSGGWNQAHR